jgi:hypothetical protein
MTRWLALFAVMVLPTAIVAQERTEKAEELRTSILSRAVVRLPGDISARNAKLGPEEPGAFPLGATVHCKYLDKQLGGLSPKFACVTPEGDELKVKYGGTNGEVYAEVASTRLLWLLGFGADRMYSVRVVCSGCPEIAGSIRTATGDRIIDPAAIERLLPGRQVLDRWSWKELDLVDPAKGGASVAERDAMKLLAVMLQHADSKPEQHRVICVGEEAGTAAQGRCERPLMMISDVGITFGRSYRLQPRASMHLEQWSKLPVWKEGPGCVGNLGDSLAATIVNPVISEQGRALLADLLAQVTDDQLRGIFEAARVHLRPRDPADGRSGFATADEWVDAFKQKRAQIAERRCDQPATSTR